MIELKAFGCEHCSMVSRRKGSVVRHERHHCRKNPARKTCGNCIHMSYEEGSSLSSISYRIGDPYEGPSWYCLSKDEDLSWDNLNKNIECEFYIMDVEE